MRAILFALVILVSLAEAQSLSKKEKEIIRNVANNYSASVELLAKSVNINSGTFNKAGVKANGDLLDPEFKQLGFETRWIDMPEAMQQIGRAHV